MTTRALTILALCMMVGAVRVVHSQAVDRPEASVTLYQDVLELLMPARAERLQSRDTEWILHIRVRERGEPEFWSRVTKRYREGGSDYSVDTRQFWPRHLDQQLAEIRKVSPSDSASDVASGAGNP